MLFRSYPRTRRAASTSAYLVLLRVEVTETVRVTAAAVRSYRTVSPLPDPPSPLRDTAAIGGLLSVALFVVSRRPAVSRHPALWSPDFPLAANFTDSDHPADFARAFYAAPTGSVVLSISLTTGTYPRRPARKWLLSS